MKCVINNNVIRISEDILEGTVSDNASVCIFIKRKNIEGLRGNTIQCFAVELIRLILQDNDILMKIEMMYYDPMQCWTVEKMLNELIKHDKTIEYITE